MVSKKIVIRNEHGLHVRPATLLAKAAESCTSKVEIHFQNNIVNAKSLLNIVSVAITKGDEILLICSGPNEDADMKKILDVLDHLK